MKSKLVVLVLIALLVLALVACGGTQEADMVLGEVAMEAPGAPEPSVDEELASSNRYTGADDSVAVSERMIIWNANISLTVEDTTETIAQVQVVARDLGGYTTNSESWLSDDQLHARLTIRVPAERYEEAMARLRGMALEVNRESSSSEDVSAQYVDLESRLRHLEAKEAQLLDFLDQAEDTEAVLAVYDHLAETQAEIEQVKGQMAYLQNLAAMATVSVELYPEEAEVQVLEEGWKPTRTLRSAARALVGTLETLGNLLIWFAVYALPILLVLAVPMIVVVWAVRRWRRRRKEAT